MIRGAWQTPGRIAVDHRPRADQDDRHADGDQSRRSEVRGAGGGGRGDGCELGFRADAGFTSDAGPDGEAADLLADPGSQPVFFHCVAGHHRSSQTHAAYLIRHRGWSAERRGRKSRRFPGRGPGAPADLDDQALIEAFARSQRFVRSRAWCRTVRFTMGAIRRPCRLQVMDAAARELRSSASGLAMWHGTRRLTISGRFSRAGSIDRARCRGRRWPERFAIIASRRC